jgi:hypothetical protein
MPPLLLRARYLNAGCMPTFCSMPGTPTTGRMPPTLLHAQLLSPNSLQTILLATENPGSRLAPSNLVQLTPLADALHLLDGDVQLHQPGGLALPWIPTDIRVFTRVQAGTPSPFAPYAWADSHTESMIATLPLPGTANTKHSPSGSTANSPLTKTTNPYVPIGNTGEVAPANSTTKGTSALDAVRQPMELKHVLEHRKLRALTPYKADAWEHLLTQAGLLPEYQHIPANLRSGFFIKLPAILSTQTPPNCPTIIKFAWQSPTLFLTSSKKAATSGLSPVGVVDSGIEECQGSHRGYGVPPVYQCLLVVARSCLVLPVCSAIQCPLGLSPPLSASLCFAPLHRSGLESLIGPFQSSPFSIIPKPAKPDKFHILQNYSFPHLPSLAFPNPSVNSFINSNDFPTTWGTFSVISLLLHRLPPGSQIATRDVSEAYRTIPLHPSQWPAAVACLGEDSFAIDTSICFGVSPSAGTYGEVRQAGSDIMQFHGIGPLSRWVDDHFFTRVQRCFLNKYNLSRSQWSQDIQDRGRHQQGSRIWFGGHLFEDGTLEEFDEDCRFPCRDLSHQSFRSAEDSHFSYNFDDIDLISHQLGIPWDRSKDQLFGSSTKYIGFIWDLSTGQVSLCPSKKEKYTHAIMEWKTRPSHVLNDVEKLYGKLLHTCLVVPSGRAFLTSMETMLATSHHSPFLPQSASKHIAEDLDWWLSLLQRPILSRTIPAPIQLFDIGALSDASSGIGIGIIICRR